MRESNSGRKRKLAAVALTAFAVGFMLLLSWLIGRPLLRFVEEPEQFRNWVDRHGVWGPLTFVGCVLLQVVIAMIPGEPFEIIAGYAFGWLEGLLLTLIGIALGSVLIFFLSRRFGKPLARLFFSEEKLDRLEFLQKTKKFRLIAFLLMFLPGTPKDLLSYAVGMTTIDLKTWLLVVTIARIPSVLTSVVGGDALGMKNYWFAAIVFGATLLISLLGLGIYNRICARQQEKRGEIDGEG